MKVSSDIIWKGKLYHTNILRAKEYVGVSFGSNKRTLIMWVSSERGLSLGWANSWSRPEEPTIGSTRPHFTGGRPRPIIWREIHEDRIGYAHATWLLVWGFLWRRPPTPEAHLHTHEWREIKGCWQCRVGTEKNEKMLKKLHFTNENVAWFRSDEIICDEKGNREEKPRNRVGNVEQREENEKGKLKTGTCLDSQKVLAQKKKRNEGKLLWQNENRTLCQKGATKN